jgi:CRISPR-associated protein Cas1
MSVQKMPSIKELPRIIDRMTFMFLEQCSINVDGGAIKIMNSDGYHCIPAASIICLILGAGTNITHEAIKLLSRSGVSILWSGSDQTRFYSSGRSLSTSAKLAIAQADIVSHPIKRMQCAKAMYAIRFPNDDFNLSTMQAMMQKEGTRMKRIYKDNAVRTGIQWNGRKYRPGEYDDSDIVNQCLTSGTQIIYAVELGIVNALNLSPSLGVIHNGKANAFIYDMADLFKSDMVIPVAFDIAKEINDGILDYSEIEREMRARIRENMRTGKILKLSVKYIMNFMLPSEDVDTDNIIWFDDVMQIWNGEDNTTILGGRNMSNEPNSDFIN